MMQSLRRKFVMITMGLVSLVLLGVVLGIGLYYTGSLRQESYQALDAALNRPSGDRGPRFELGKPVPEGFEASPTFTLSMGRDGTARLYNAEYIDVDEAQLPDILEQVQAQDGDRGELADYNLRYLVRQTKDETRIAFTDLSLEKSRILGILSITAAAAAGALVIFLILSILLSRWALRPAERAWQRQRQFVANASHELKTPLTVILANMGIIKGHQEDSVAAQMTWINNSEEEALRMKGLVEDLLFLAKGDDAQKKPALLPLDLSDSAATMALSFEPVVFENGLQMITDIEPGLSIIGDEGQVKQMISILLDNAVKYAVPGSEISLSVRRVQHQAKIAVYNRSEALPPGDLNRLFERFYRADPSRAAPGYGLGLSIAMMIAESHRGKITAQSEGEGIVFTVTLPVK